MRPPSPTWECDYANDRRKHSHRCRCCDRIVQQGERVLMIRLKGYRGSKTWALHVKPCADVAFGNADTGNAAGWTWRDAFECWGTEHMRRLGWAASVPEHPMMRAGAVKSEAA